MVELRDLVITAVFWLLYCVAVVIYRLYFSPLAKFPGPKLAAATLWYEFYYEVIQEGQFMFHTRELHKQYGPIIRINPFELHVDDPTGEFYHVVFSGTGIRDKNPYEIKQFGTSDTGFGTVDHYLHRKRRRAMNPFFSMASIDRLEPVMTTMIEKLCRRIDEVKEASMAVNMRLVYLCFTTDFITTYAMNNSWGHLDTPDFSPLWCQTIKETGAMSKWIKQFPFLYPALTSLPDWLVGKINPGMILVLDMQRKIQGMVKEIKGGKVPDEETTLNGGARTIFQTILSSDLPPSEKSFSMLWQEGQNIVGAGADATAYVLTMTTFHLLNNPDKLNKLRQELSSAAASLPQGQDWNLATTRQLPYLTAVVLEGLRLSYGPSSRLTRIAPTEELRYGNWIIPKGTPVSMTAFIMHHNENLFPDSDSFIPERWSEREGGPASLERYMVTFSKGSRQCIGGNLAKAEVSLTLATVFHRYQDMRLFDTNFERDVKLMHDMFLPQPSKDSKGVRVLF